jgi:two-component sensor histidine kinase
VASAEPPRPPTGGEHRWLSGLKARMAFVLGVVLVPALLYSCWQALEAYRDRRAQQARTVDAALSVIASYEAELFDKTRTLLLRLAAEPAIRRAEQPACSERLMEARNRTWDYLAFVVTDADGKVLCTSLPELAASFGDQVFFKALRNGPPFVTSEVLPRQGGKAETMVVGVPLREPATSTFTGAVLVGINLQNFQRAIDSLRLPRGGVAYLIDREGRFVVEPPARDAAGARAVLGPQLFARLLEQPRDGVAAQGDDGVRRDHYMTGIAGGDLFVVVGLPSPPRFSWLQRELVIGIFAPTLMLALAVVTIWIASDYLVTRHVRTLTVAARAYSRGELDLRLDLASAPQEFQELARTLARMADRIHRREDELRASLQQKELLIREIHHRVKNNLQIVTSLLNLRAQRLPSPVARDAVRQAQMRIGALALAHRSLYQRDDIQEIELHELLHELCGMLQEVNEADHTAVQLSIEAEPTRIPADQAIPLALLVTEAVSNAFRHAFRPERDGRIEVRLTSHGHRVHLVVADDGVGLADSKDGVGMGVTLMHMLAKQLGGNLSVIESAGTRLEVDFPLAWPHGTATGAAAPATV